MLTGKDVYEAARSHLAKQGFEDLEWEDFIPEAQDFYIDLAEQLNKTHILPLQGESDACLQGEKTTLLDAVTAINDLNGRILALQGLVRAYQNFTKYDIPLLKANREAWRAKSDELHKQAQQLLGEEPKS